VNGAVFYLVIFVVIGFMLWTTFSQQRRAKKAQEELQRMLKKGDDVITIGGMYGTIRGIDSEYVVLEIARGTRVRFLRRAIREIVSEEDDYDDEVVEEYDDVDDEYDDADDDAPDDDTDDAEAEGEADDEYVEDDEPEAPSAPVPPKGPSS
jgi:preprotein translocase subunit YajC